ncbi:cell division protein FtsZ [Ventosimonas gracilis]|uniref:Cell division protein FtsZ n=1 Tax=Ventosimonas gracilis TaxID=1680762 RepID=A0A139SVB0_9GAMM|nr:cell division protein FtsZ [Ventosimonas gracilis]KXU38401.1 cell division protein FtsZ [Ventosimonas gracilis]
MLEVLDNALQGEALQRAVIKVIGVGGGGCNAIDNMKRSGIEGVELICINTDLQSLQKAQADQRIVIGRNLTRGLGAGGKPEIGRSAAEEDRAAIGELLEGTDMLFITTGMGGGTGTGAIPVIAEIAREKGILTVAVVTRPFAYEGSKRMKIAEEGIRTLVESVDSLITIPNEKLLTILEEDVCMVEAYAKVDDVLLGAVRGISDIIQKAGLQNVDFADIKTMMSQMGMAVMGSGSASGPNRAREATEAAIHNPLLEDVNLQGARGILVNITGDFGPRDVKAVAEMLGTFSSEEADIKIGTVVDRDKQGELQVTVIVTGLERPHSVLEKTRETLAPQAGRTLRALSVADVEPRPLARGGQRLNAAAAVDSDYLDIPAWLRNQAD